ncbi:SMI1/KNR4 family protein [Streptomyces flaveolus]|uniref:SMI1/KNR4 family protein n=1 Tax=Streptomyces flaveolus TaxID=67297 RepID=UPI0036FB7E26
MPHPAIARLRELLPVPASGGDPVDWAEIEQTTGLALPADYREFVETYGGGEIDEYIGVLTPPVPDSPCGEVLDLINPVIDETEDLRTLLMTDVLPPVWTFASLGEGDVAFWLCEGAPDDWRVAVWERQIAYGDNRWTVFDGGMAAFLLAVLTGGIAPFSDELSEIDQHEFTSWRAWRTR